ncbi:MAG: RecQ family ATP-dependent DNA helicase [Desulfobacterales bacterium]|nr:RecQ family ATP-dependent DNA helicase [Desulfobacterales bacterium]
MTFDRLSARTLALDLEVSRSGSRLRRIGALFQERPFEWAEGQGPVSEALAALDAFGHSATFVLGHNILRHDLPLLQALAPGMRLLSRPVIDTLLLSPLAFPQNPYHRLVKDYKLVRAALSDPLQDARLALALFKDQWQSFGSQAQENPQILSVYRFCFEQSRFGAFSGDGLAQLFAALGAPPLAGVSQVEDIFRHLTSGNVCRQAAAGVIAQLATAPPTAPIAAYGLAWLRVAGSNSVLPPWVRHQFPGIVPFLTRLRDQPCGDPACDYCRTMHDPDTQLQRFFGFEAFRPAPKTSDGHSLQREVVLHGLRDQPLLAILPTGGGKSLCYQLPALVRHMRRGQLTVVLSPLQALMKDQVDNLVANTGTPFAAAIYGLLTPPERGEVMERVRMGDIAILYISPEQLRSRSVREVLSQREIGCWVFDEAHCLSKWGHDFRPDYLYAGRFIREFTQAQQLPMPPMNCFTATAKPDVIEEITAYFQTELKQTLHLFEGGVERGNLIFDIIPVSEAQKPEQTLAIVQRHLEGQDTASAIVYAARRKTTEQIRDYLVQKGMTAEAFHAGLEAHDKRRIIEAFVAGQVPVICATNAFGMGIDKSDIRLVLHYDLPGSLENYLQEAGRAGRDLKPAHCILLYDPQDAETQFSLGAYSEIQRREIQQILGCLRRAKRNRDNDIVITTQELLRDEELAALFDPQDGANDTRVRTALAWLERAGLLERNQNLTQVFQGKPLVKSIAAAEETLKRLNLSPTGEQLWRGILAVMFNAPPDQGLSADDIAERLFSSADQLRRLERSSGLTPAQMVIQAMHDMADARLLDKGLMLSAFLQTKGTRNARLLLAQVGDLEQRLLKLMQEEAPDAENGEWLTLDLSRVNQRLQNDGAPSDVVTLRHLLKGLVGDGKGLAGSHGAVELKHIGRNRYRVQLRRGWQTIVETAALRRNVAALILGELLAKAKGAAEADKETPGELLVEFGAEDLAAAIRHDLLLHAQVSKPLAAIDRGLMFLHEHKIVTLQNGLAVFRQAMTIRLNPSERRRQYTVGDFKPLAAHYRERRFQVHVIVEYAQLAMEQLARALGLVLDYFAMPRMAFIQKYFAHRQEILERATSVDSYRRIVEALHHPVQIDIVGRPTEANLLVLAGPGAGKTRVVVHRCAYLLRVERVPPSRILVMCFNHHAAVALRRRLHDLVGPDARGVTVATYHGAALRLAGLSMREWLAGRESADIIDFDAPLAAAVALLKGEAPLAGLDGDTLREQLLQGFSHILVDEYQDIDQAQYDLVSAIAGRTRPEAENRLAILAVGDDDQNIYAFRGANVGFIQRFRQDYQADPIYMVENFRSSAHIIAAANQLIAHNRDRMKGDHPIRIDRQRAAEPAGGPWAALDPVAQGRVQRLVVQNASHQAAAVFQELSRLTALSPDLNWENCAVLGRTNESLTAVRACFESQGVTVRRNLAQPLPLPRVREIHGFLESLKQIENQIHAASELNGLLPETGANPWAALLAEWHAAYGLETEDAQLPVQFYVDWLYEALAEQRRERTLGRGLFLNTIHAAKGMEFDHVFILDGGWHLSPERSKQEEERRLLYVGMTRARQTLCLLELKPQGNPLIRDLSGDALLHRQAAPQGETTAEATAQRYDLLGLKDIFLSYAGTFPPSHPIHAHLAQLAAGHRLHLAAAGSGVEVRDPENFPVARLSKEAAALWAPRLEDILEARVVAMLRWRADDASGDYRSLARTEAWEVPIIEIVSR